jgi:hypothetical protein
VPYGADLATYVSGNSVIVDASVLTAWAAGEACTWGAPQHVLMSFWRSGTSRHVLGSIMSHMSSICSLFSWLTVVLLLQLCCLLGWLDPADQS